MKLIHNFLFAILTLSFASCNPGIFLDEPDIEEVQEITIEGDGGEVSLTIPSKNFLSLELGYSSFSNQYLKYYNEKGEEVSLGSEGSLIVRAVYESLYRKFEVEKRGSKLMVKSICNTLATESTYPLNLNYLYGNKTINITVLPGRPLQVEDVVYEDMVTDERFAVKRITDGFHNETSLSQIVQIWPYLNERASVLVSVARNSPLMGESFNLPVPVYKNGEWIIAERAGIKLGFAQSFDGPAWNTIVDVSVPANSNVKIFTDVVYASAQAKGQMRLKNEILDIAFSEYIEVTSKYPTHHEITVEDAK